MAAAATAVAGDAAGAGDDDSGEVAAVDGDPSRKGPSW